MPSLRFVAVNAFDDGVAQQIAELRPDVACIHGAPSLLRWRSACASIAREAGMVVVCGGRTAGGNLILSSLGVDVDGTRELPFSGHRGPRPPGAAIAAMRLLGSAFLVAAVRSPTDELQRALDEISPQRPPAVLTAVGAFGDLAAGRTALPGGVFVDEGITVASADEIAGGVRADLVLQ